jgi:hypothetical protein
LKINAILRYLSVPCAKLEKSIMFEKKPGTFKSPDLSKLKEVIIDHRTKIYIALDADIEEARTRYLSRNTTIKSK